MAALFLIGMIFLITFSRSGWRSDGPSDEWIFAAILNPSILFLRRDNDDECVEIERRGDQFREEEYYWKRIQDMPRVREENTF